MLYPELTLRFIGGRLALDFVNSMPSNNELPWNKLIEFLESARIVTPERGGELRQLERSNTQAAESLLRKARRLATTLRLAFGAVLHKQKVLREWIEPVNEILRITEGHDELVFADNDWEIQFVASESGLEWLLAAVARSAAEIIAEGPRARLRLCANPRCGLFFYDTSRTHRRRWCSMTVCGNRHKVAAFARRHGSARHAGH
ncbi:MAG TPA: CGNR zinc finger domain-containing protein [Candidatus Acidoferrum sp.]|nr:CGNR zinc finger domain-containing protein [Candidatus Acidoferrum sp.]